MQTWQQWHFRHRSVQRVNSKKESYLNIITCKLAFFLRSANLIARLVELGLSLSSTDITQDYFGHALKLICRFELHQIWVTFIRIIKGPERQLMRLHTFHERRIACTKIFGKIQFLQCSAKIIRRDGVPANKKQGIDLTYSYPTALTSDWMLNYLSSWRCRTAVMQR